jgi:UTP--glucose-1-phosphate uridylyltransferase
MTGKGIGDLKAVLPIAGLGTRMLPATKEQPKEMLPIFSRTARNSLCVKPILQLIFEQLYEVGLREFIFVVGRGKRAVEDHFTPDYGYLELMRNHGSPLLWDFEEFYRKLNSSIMVWINQPHPLGFGHAVLLCERSVGESAFLVHAGDTYIVDGQRVVERMYRCFEKESPDALLLLQEVENPKQYGVAIVEDRGEFLKVVQVLEKPETPPSNLSIVPLYIFNASIFRALKTVGPGVGGEIQLTDGIQRLIEWGYKVLALKLGDYAKLDVGSPQLYWEALKISYELSTKSQNNTKS